MIIHVDMSKKFYKKTKVGVAWIDNTKKKHKGLALSGTLIKKLIKDVNADYDFPRLYAICIYLIIKNDIGKINKIVVCNDEPFIEVGDYLNLLISKKHNCDNLNIISITDYRYELGKRKIKSPADRIASSYRKRALKEKQWNKGKKLNVVKTNYKEVLELWNSIEKLSGL